MLLLPNTALSGTILEIKGIATEAVTASLSSEVMPDASTARTVYSYVLSFSSPVSL